MRCLKYWLSLSFAIVSFTACNQKLHQQQTKESIMQSLSNQSNYSNKFSFALMHQLGKSLPNTKNLFISPLSIQLDLGMVQNGAMGKSLKQITEVLQQGNLSLNSINQNNKNIILHLPNLDKSVSLGIYNSLWYKKNFAINRNFTSLVKKNYQADITGLEFNETAKHKINQWVSDKTNGKIKNIIDEIDPSMQLFLINALYFKGDWRIPFKASKTRNTDFAIENGNTVQVKMMHQTSSFNFIQSNDFKAIELPYGQGQYVMTILLPKGKNTLKSILGSLNNDSWQSMQNKMIMQEVQVGLPKFSIKGAEYDLIPILEQMGVTDIFDANKADLTKLATGELSQKLVVSLLKQYTYINVDELGTEAAAVTNTGISVTSMLLPAESFICDRPFGFIISEKTTNTILFVGKMMEP